MFTEEWFTVGLRLITSTPLDRRKGCDGPSLNTGQYHYPLNFRPDRQELPITGLIKSVEWHVTSYSWTSGTFPPSAGTYATLSGGGNPPQNGGITVTSITANGTAASPELIIINGDFTISGGKTFTINATTTGNPAVVSSANSYVTIWVKGKFTTSGSGLVTQASGTNVKWIVDNDITVSGDAYSNHNGTAATDSFIGIGNHKFTDSGSATFTGTVDAPSFTGSTISGSGDYTGAFLGSDLTISGSGSFHYDETLNGNSNPTIGNYAFASWFENNSDPTHKDVSGNYVVY